MDLTSPTRPARRRTHPTGTTAPTDPTTRTHRTDTTGPTDPTTPAAPTDPAARGDDPTDREMVAHLMALVADGDCPALWRLRELADVPVRSRVRGELRRLGVRYQAEDLDAMVTDAVLAIAEVAASWRPGGAPPWAWAHHRVLRAVHRHVGTFADSLEALGDGDPDGALGRLDSRDRAATRPASTHEETDPGDAVASAVRQVLRAVAVDHPDLAVLDAALDDLATPRDAAVWLTVLSEQASGNRRPAVTAGALFGMRPEAVRQVVLRLRRRLDAALVDGRFPGLAALPPFAPPGR